MTFRTDYPPKPAKIYFFGTCLIDLFYPEAGISAMKLIAREGVRVVYPPDQTCCGQPAWNSGFRSEAQRVARQQLRCFPEPIPVVVPSGSCAGMLRHHYPALFRGETEEQRVAAFATRVFELTEFLRHVLQVELKDLGKPTTVVLHTSCSARREMNVAPEHEDLLRQLEGVELRHPERTEECCGFGGTFAVKHPEISAAMVRDKAETLVQTGAECLVTGDCGCLMNVTGFLQHADQALRGQHIASFLWERTHASTDD